MVRLTLKADFRRIGPRSPRVVLLDNGPRILAGFSEDLSRKAHARLIAMGVEIHTGAPVDQVDDRGVVVGGKRIASRTVLWTAGVRPSPAGRWLRPETDPAGRGRPHPHLSTPGHPTGCGVRHTPAPEHQRPPPP